jgi:hypothetical protein
LTLPFIERGNRTNAVPLLDLSGKPTQYKRAPLLE